MKKDEITSSSDMFLYKAIIDFKSAKALFEIFENDDIEIYIDKIYFDLQQSTEKLLKCMLTQHKIDFPKIHDLKKLIKECRKHNILLIDNIDNLMDLTDYAVEGRYSILCDDISDSKSYFDTIEEFIIFVKGDKS